MAPSHIAYKSRLCQLLLSYSSLASIIWTLLQATLVVADDPATPVFTFSPTPVFDPGDHPVCPDFRITTRFSPKVPKAGGHVTVTVKLWASTSAEPASLVVHVPDGLDLVKAPRTKRGEASFYSVYDDLDDEHMLVWENIPLSRTDRKPQNFRFRLKIEECPPSNEFELDLLTSLMDGYCLDLIATPTLTVQPKKGQASCTVSNASKSKAAAVAGNGENNGMNVAETQAQTCSACSSEGASDETYALILSPGPQIKWVDVDWGAYHITLSGYSLTSTEKMKLKTALQGKSPSPGLKFNNCSPWHLTPNHEIPYPSKNVSPVPNFVNRPINISGVFYDGLLLDSGALCSLKQRLTYWANKVANPPIRMKKTFQNKGPAVNDSTADCSVQMGTCPCTNPVHTLRFQPFPYHVTLAKQGTSPSSKSEYSWNKIVRPDFLGLDGSTRLDWSLWLNKKPSCQCEKCGYCETERKKGSGFWDKIVPCSQ